MSREFVYLIAAENNNWEKNHSIELLDMRKIPMTQRDNIGLGDAAHAAIGEFTNAKCAAPEVETATTEMDQHREIGAFSSAKCKEPGIGEFSSAKCRDTGIGEFSSAKCG